MWNGVEVGACGRPLDWTSERLGLLDVGEADFFFQVFCLCETNTANAILTRCVGRGEHCGVEFEFELV